MYKFGIYLSVVQLTSAQQNVQKGEKIIGCRDISSNVPFLYFLKISEISWHSQVVEKEDIGLK